MERNWPAAQLLAATGSALLVFIFPPLSCEAFILRARYCYFRFCNKNNLIPWSNVSWLSSPDEIVDSPPMAAWFSCVPGQWNSFETEAISELRMRLGLLSIYMLGSVRLSDTGYCGTVYALYICFWWIFVASVGNCGTLIINSVFPGPCWLARRRNSRQRIQNMLIVIYLEDDFTLFECCCEHPNHKLAFFPMVVQNNNIRSMGSCTSCT